MKIKVEKAWRDYVTYVTYVSQGCQRFTLHEGPKEDCLWYAAMFRRALKNHDAEVLSKRMKRVRKFRGNGQPMVYNSIQGRQD